MKINDYTLSGYDVFPNDFVKPSCLFSVMQTAAGQDSAQYGAGYNDLIKDKMAFVMTKARLVIEAPIRNETKISVKTWGKKISGVSFLRDYLVYGEGGEVVARASTQWVLIDFESRHLLRPSALKTDVSSNLDESSEVEINRRLSVNEELSPIFYERKINFSDADINCHLNNCRYADLVCDACGFDFTKQHVTDIEIHYVSELSIGETVEIESFAEGNTATLVGKKKSCGTVSFSARVKVE